MSRDEEEEEDYSQNEQEDQEAEEEDYEDLMNANDVIINAAQREQPLDYYPQIDDKARTEEQRSLSQLQKAELNLREECNARPESRGDHGKRERTQPKGGESDKITAVKQSTVTTNRS